LLNNEESSSSGTPVSPPPPPPPPSPPALLTTIEETIRSKQDPPQQPKPSPTKQQQQQQQQSSLTVRDNLLSEIRNFKFSDQPRRRRIATIERSEEDNLTLERRRRLQDRQYAMLDRSFRRLNRFDINGDEPEFNDVKEGATNNDSGSGGNADDDEDDNGLEDNDEDWLLE
jgi:hypothetical protein